MTFNFIRPFNTINDKMFHSFARQDGFQEFILLKSLLLSS